ncbi:MAG: hypothetical protein ABI651_01690 [Verrucomicrobiota bacterium]
MARQTKSMRQIKEILRLKFQHRLSVREIARSCAVPASTVGDYLKRAELAGLSRPLPEEWTEHQILERLLGVRIHRPKFRKLCPIGPPFIGGCWMFFGRNSRFRGLDGSSWNKGECFG